MPDLKDVVNVRRDRESRAMPVETALANETYGQRQAQTANAADNQDGYWDDAAGGFRSYFQAGVSLAGGPDVAK